MLVIGQEGLWGKYATMLERAASRRKEGRKGKQKVTDVHLYLNLSTYLSSKPTQAHWGNAQKPFCSNILTLNPNVGL